ncbi:MAG: glycosyltransferase family 2 protein [Desulfosarcina sp.]|nr:glycosyltransferase family 2 protein [Desulfosarcina sp.]MBC2742131.1 glycosyltransferase family 2 protein [Desulfosarcina sp.]MBC2765044.1 glycosyltransferase family 2 protein [Desulfosarcina sp.]
MNVSAKQLVTLFKETINFPQPNTLEGSAESISNYYKMTRQFAKMAYIYQDLIPEGYDVLSILELADFILNLKFEEFQKIANNLPFILDGVILQDKTTSYPEADVDPSWEPAIAMLSQNLPNEIELTDGSQDTLFFEAATDLLNKFPETSALQNLDRWITSRPEKYKNAMLLVSKQALSKMYVKQIDCPLHVSLVLAMYNEHNRIRPKSSDNPNGEDFVRRKMKQMEWLLKDSPHSFNMILVDDGCPKQSGTKAQEIIEKEGYKNVNVLYLDDGIKRQSAVIKGLKSTSESRKGGSIQYGMWQAVKKYSEGDKPHIVVFTDADMATPVNEIGFLLDKQDDETMLAIASRYDAGSICRGPWGKNGEVQGLTEFDRRMVGLRGLVFSKLFPQTGKITDTQCGLKAFNSKLLRQILLKTKVRTFSFDIELLVLAASTDTAIAIAPIYWHDSLAESSFWGNASEKTNDDDSSSGD